MVVRSYLATWEVELMNLEQKTKATAINKLQSQIADCLNKDKAQSLPADESLILKECGYLIRLVALRPRSEAEIEDKLRQRAASEEIRAEVLNRAKNNGLIDDYAFAEQWVRQRSQNKRLGKIALRHELKQKKVADSIIEAVLSELDSDQNYKNCQAIVRAKLKSHNRRLNQIAAVDSAQSSFEERMKLEREKEKILKNVISAAARRGHGVSLAFQIAKSELDALGIT